jgi:hypothetical protein
MQRIEKSKQMSLHTKNTEKYKTYTKLLCAELSHFQALKSPNTKKQKKIPIVLYFTSLCIMHYASIHYYIYAYLIFYFFKETIENFLYLSNLGV